MKNFLRRDFLRILGTGAITLAMSPALVHGADSAPAPAAGAGADGKKPGILVAYFSHSGNTRKIAEYIHRAVGGDLIRIENLEPYPANYQQLTEFAKKEKEANARPKLKTRLANPEQYDLVFLGYPNWWSSMPMPVYTFVENNGLNGKTIAPFTTHGGGGLGHSVEDLQEIAPQARILKPLAVNGSSVDRAEKNVQDWIKGLGVTSAGGAARPNGGR